MNARRETLGGALLAALVLIALPALASAAQLYQLPEGKRSNTTVATTEEGMVLFGAEDIAVGGAGLPAIGILNPALATPGTANGMTLEPTPTNGVTAPVLIDLEYDPVFHNAWFTRSDKVVGRAAVSAGSVGAMFIKEAPGGVLLHGIGAAPDGSAWFAETQSLPTPAGPPYYGNRLAHIDTSMTITEMGNLALQTGTFVGPRWSARPWGVTVGDDGTPWFTQSSADSGGYRIARVLSSVEGTYKEYSPPCGGTPCSGTYSGVGPTDVAVDADGDVWFTNELKASIGRLHFDGSGNATATEYSLVSFEPNLSGSVPRAIATAHDGTLWVAVAGNEVHPETNAIVRIVPGTEPSASVYGVSSTPGSFEISPQAVAPERSGDDVWFVGKTAHGEPGLIGRLAGVLGEGGEEPGGPGEEPGGGGTAPTPAAPAAAPTPVPAQPRTESGPLKATAVGNAKPPAIKVRERSALFDQGCLGAPNERCKLIYVVCQYNGVREVIPNFPGASRVLARLRRGGKRGGRKPKHPVVLGKAKVSLRGGERRRVKVSLNGKGRKLENHSKRRRLRANVYIFQSIGGGQYRRVATKRVTFKLKPRKRGKGGRGA